jgi:hypothetical protein
MASKTILAPIPYRVPSCSWASLDHEVFSNPRMSSNLEAIAEVSSINITPSSGDILGAIKYASLSLSSSFFIHGALVESKNDENSSDWILIAGEDEEELDPIWNNIYMDHWDQQLSHVWFFALCLHSMFIYGLVLESTGQARGQYRRVGLFEWRERSFHAIQETVNREACLPQEDDCLSISRENKGKKKYTIELV